MNRIVVLITVICFTVISCTKDKTDYQAEIDTVIPDQTDFKEAAQIRSGNYTLSIEALNGSFYQSYNEIRVKIRHTGSGQEVSPAAVTFLPIATSANGTNSTCPHLQALTYDQDGKFYSGYAIYTLESNSETSWKLHLTFTIDGHVHEVMHPIAVEPQSNKNLNTTTFIGQDGETYLIALIGPRRPQVGENELIAGIYKKTNTASLPESKSQDLLHEAYMEVKNYTLQLDPRMPEPSMGNHSSPNNKDLRQQEDNVYRGVVNYTMTGNWTLNFIMLNENGKIVKGTVVPKDFTPGVEGAKSELHIDILF